MSQTGCNAVITKQPFRENLKRSNNMSTHIISLFYQDQIYRVHHNLCKKMVQNLMVPRSTNKVSDPTWNQDNIVNIVLTFKEPFGTESCRGYFNDFGINLHMMQNHLLQMLCLVAMEKPPSTDSNNIHSKKFKVSKCISKVQENNAVLSLCLGNPNREDVAMEEWYLDGSTRPRGSTTATFIPS